VIARMALVLVIACGSSKATIDAPAGLGSGAACDTTNDQCTTGLKCCTQPTQPPHAICVAPTSSGGCPLVP